VILHTVIVVNSQKMIRKSRNGSVKSLKPYGEI